MFAHLRRAVIVSIVLFVVCGLAYPALEVGVAQLFFHHQANASIVSDGTRPIGSTEVGQVWKAPKWFQGRPDADNPMATGSQNYGPKSKLLLEFSRGEIAALRKEGVRPTIDLVTGSGSGVDPDISPADAYDEAPAVARANHLALRTVDHLIAAHVVGAYWGFLGAPYVNVLELNLALHRLVAS